MSSSQCEQTRDPPPSTSRGDGSCCAQTERAPLLAYRSDPALIQACLRGEKAAWDALVEQYGRLVYSIPRRYGLTPEDADDVFQGVFLNAYRSLAKLKDQARLSSWLITAANRECWRVAKRREKHRHPDASIADLAAPDDDQAEQWERQHLVRQALATIGGKSQRLLEAMFLDPSDSSYGAIAERLGMKVGSIGPMRARCFEKLQRVLADMGFNESPQRRSPRKRAEPIRRKRVLPAYAGAVT